MRESCDARRLGDELEAIRNEAMQKRHGSMQENERERMSKEQAMSAFNSRIIEQLDTANLPIDRTTF